MYSFIKEQKEFEVGGISFGGQPGKNPTVLFGTVFYGKQFKTLDETSFKLAKDMVEIQKALGEKTGVGAVADIYIRGEKNIKTQIDFILDNSDDAFAIDISDAQTRIKTLHYLDERDVLDRVIYNSINLGLTVDEVDALNTHTPECAIVLAYNPRDMSVEGRSQILVDGAGMLAVRDKGLLDIVEDAGIKKILIDTGATPFGSQSAETMRALPVFKNQFGFPTGCSIHNTLESWSWMKDYREEDDVGYNCANAAANSLVSFFSGDYIVYGPASSANHIFPAVAFVDKLVAEGAVDFFGQNISENHPYHKLE